MSQIQQNGIDAQKTTIYWVRYCTVQSVNVHNNLER